MTRTRCEVCDNLLPPPFIKIENMPIRMGISEISGEATVENLCYSNCASCNTVQITEVPELEKVYAVNHNRSVVGRTWEQHYISFSEFIKLQLGLHSKILEIGDPSAKIASMLSNSDCVDSWKILEPNHEPISVDKISFERIFFSLQYQDLVKYDAIVMSHMFEHFTDYTIINKFTDLLKPGGIVIISVPNMEHLLDIKALPPAGMHFEHTVFLNRYNIQMLFKRYAFRLVAYNKFQNHSEFYCFKSQDLSLDEWEGWFTPMPNKYQNSTQSVYDSKQEKIELYNKKMIDRPSFVYGAHIQTQMLIKMGLNEYSLLGALDNDALKQGKYVNGTNLKVYPLSEITKHQFPLVLCDMGAYNDEICDQLRSLNPYVEIV